MLIRSISFLSCCEGRYCCMRSFSLPFPTILVRLGCRILFLSERSLFVSGVCPRFLKINSMSIPLTLSIFDVRGTLFSKFVLFDGSMLFRGEKVWIEFLLLVCSRVCFVRCDWSDFVVDDCRWMCCVILPFVRLNSNKPYI